LLTRIEAALVVKELLEESDKVVSVLTDVVVGVACVVVSWVVVGLAAVVDVVVGVFCWLGGFLVVEG
jgi:hypothetical protein